MSGIPVPESETEGTPKNEGEELAMRARALRIVATDLHEAAHQTFMESATKEVSGVHALRMLGRVVSLTVLRALATECILKSIAFQEKGAYRRTHDLVELYDDLARDTRKELEELADTEGILSPRIILGRHRKDFVEWRYPKEGGTNMIDLESILQIIDPMYPRGIEAVVKLPYDE